MASARWSAAEQGLIHCSGTVRLEDGQITFQGLTATAATKLVAVTGGTGRYQGAGGEATLVENPDQTGTLTTRLRRSWADLQHRRRAPDTGPG